MIPIIVKIGREKKPTWHEEMSPYNKFWKMCVENGIAKNTQPHFYHTILWRVV